MHELSMFLISSRASSWVSVSSWRWTWEMTNKDVFIQHDSTDVHWLRDQTPELGNTYYCPVLSLDCSLVASFDQGTVFRNSPCSRPCDSPFTHPLISCTRHVYSMKPFLTPSAPVPSPNQTERGPLLPSPRGHLQISTITPNLPFYNWRYFHIYPHDCELSESTGSA